MKVGDQMIDGAKVVGRPNEDTSFPALLDEWTSGLHSRFKNAHRGSSDGPDFFSSFSHFIQGCRRGSRERVALLVHDVIGWIFGFDRLESSSADVKDDICAFHSAFSQLGEKLFSEMQTCRGCGDGAWLAGIHGLITLGVDGLICTRDIRRKRRMTITLDRFIQWQSGS